MRAINKRIIQVRRDKGVHNNNLHNRKNRTQKKYVHEICTYILKDLECKKLLKIKDYY